ncbi:hypothetical protein DID88_005943 [Monilinia fructigena]|uniref:Nitrogen regulatory protein areA GATA-like domain-containing protein n=1 Tax=Monilinia fructigena TaxID=38457 RepID=A0A395J193_9HELO|nr:hypothetical protein DID88_005943 [Monilinia fructigena]
MDLSREDEYFEWVDMTDVVDAAPRIIRQPEVSALRLICVDDTDDDEIEFPSYDEIKWNDNIEDQVPKEQYDAQVEYYLQSPSLQSTYLEDDMSLCSTPPFLSPSDQSPEPELSELSEPPEAMEYCDITETIDDMAVKPKPSHHVDYLSYEWPEEDLWASWKYVQSNRTAYENGRRLENASWRCWAKKRSNLKTVAPETVNWEKGCDTTWLYGPLHKRFSSSSLAGTSIDSNSRPNSTRSVSCADVDVKPILKQRRLCDILMNRSSSIASAFDGMFFAFPFLWPIISYIDVVKKIYANGESALEEEVFGSTTSNVQPPSKSYIRTVVKLTNSSSKNVDEVNSLSAAVHSLQDSLQHDHFVLPRFEYEEYASTAISNDDDEWELSMIGMEFKSPSISMTVGKVY